MSLFEFINSTEFVINVAINAVVVVAVFIDVVLVIDIIFADASIYLYKNKMKKAMTSARIIIFLKVFCVLNLMYLDHPFPIENNRKSR